MREVLATRHMGKVIRAYRHHRAHGRHPLPQQVVAQWLGTTQSRLSDLEIGPPPQQLDRLIRYARMLGIPQRHLWFSLPPQPAPAPEQRVLNGQVSPSGAATPDREPNDEAVSWLERRDFLSVVTGMALGAGAGVSAGAGSGAGAGSSAAGLPAAAEQASLIPAVPLEPLGRVGLSDVELIEATTAAFRDLSNRWGGGLSRASIITQLTWVEATARHASYPSEMVRGRLLAALADLAGVAAFSSYDVKEHEQARRLWMLGLRAAGQARRVDLTQDLLHLLAHQALHLQRPQEALRLIRLAYATGDADQQGTELALAQLSAYEAWCHAAMGSVQPCHRALGRAEDHLDSSRDAEGPPCIVLGHLDHAELQGLRGHVYHVLAHHVPGAADKAEPLLREAVATRAAGQVRSRTLNLIGLAATYFQRRESIEEGVTLAGQALDNAATLGSPRVKDRLRVLDPVTAPFAGQPDVAALRHRLGTVLADA